ncbi:hypothetical protein FVB32_08440 [Flagellimonas hymeniacidonis]|uniref:Uncharacterized protein n=1 Tax=Flagellimonas hymeniacidonis TaxID=2603628 RepID=A0A5C8VAZ3_9FLAO|nr:hypothetical protein [Flagellimonas hymeniacidonis]TXN38309.1 hypothetical protein FVB32_08440 [Flagellimonas hymeniacidonis]
MQDLVKQLMKAIGDKEVWKNAKGCYMLAIAHQRNLELPMVRSFWIDFEEPRIKIQTRSNQKNSTKVLNRTNGWTIEKGVSSFWDEKTVNDYHLFWQGIPTRIFHLLSRKERNLSYEMESNKIHFSFKGNSIFWIALDHGGNPSAHGNSNPKSKTYFLGEMTSYRKINLWKEAVEQGGKQRIELIDYQLLNDMSHISYDPLSPII